MEDVYELRGSAIEDHTLVWVDSSQRDAGGTGSDYSVNLIEPLKNVVGIRVIEATIPATIMSIDERNDSLAIHTIGYTDQLPVSPEHLLQVHTAGQMGGAWVRVGDAQDKQTFYDLGHDAEHHVAHHQMAVFSANDTASIVLASEDDDPGDIVVCVVPGNVASEFGDLASFDPIARSTVIECLISGDMEYVCTFDIIAGLYTLPHGKYDSLRDFINEVSHKYAETKTGVMLNFVAPQSDKPERSFQIHIDPSQVWTSVNTSDPGYAHTYMSMQNFWCAVWSGSRSIRTLGLHTNPVSLHTRAGSFLTSEALPRYQGRLRARTMVDLTAERYVWLRCPEVEHHMCAGVGQVLQRGIGVFRLDVPGVLNQDKTEYISVVPSQFHPIGRLAKLSFRFDRGSTGQPYDFKEINHFMLLSISTLRPDRAAVYKTLPKALNPDYLPNTLEHEMRDLTRKGATSGRRSHLTKEQMMRAIALHNASLVSNSDNV